SNIILRRADPAAAASAHLAPGALAREVATRRDAFGRHFVPVALQFLGDELCKARKRALPHLRTCDADHTGIVGLDCNPDVDFSCRALRLHRANAEREA